MNKALVDEIKKFRESLVVNSVLIRCLVYRRYLEAQFSVKGIMAITDNELIRYAGDQLNSVKNREFVKHYRSLESLIRGLELNITNRDDLIAGTSNIYYGSFKNSFDFSEIQQYIKKEALLKNEWVATIN